MFMLFWDRCLLPMQASSCLQGGKKALCCLNHSFWIIGFPGCIGPPRNSACDLSLLPSSAFLWPASVQGGVSAPALQEMRSESTGGKLLWLNFTEHGSVFLNISKFPSPLCQASCLHPLGTQGFSVFQAGQQLGLSEPEVLLLGEPGSASSELKASRISA